MSQHDSTHGGETSGESTSIIGQIRHWFVNDYLHPTVSGNSDRLLVKIGNLCSSLFFITFMASPFIAILVSTVIAGGFDAGMKIAIIFPMAIGIITLISFISNVIFQFVGVIHRK